MKKSKGHIRGVLGRLLLISGAICTICTMLIFGATKFIVEPNLEDVAGMRAEAAVSKVINNSLVQQFENKDETPRLFEVTRDKSGSIEMIQADSAQINLMMSELSVRLQQNFKRMENEKYEVPIGTLFGSKVLSQLGPSVDLTIIPLSVSSMDFRTEFESQGINQTKYKIYFEIDCRIRVLAPFSSDVFNKNCTVLVAEAVILGEVPHSYVQVPEEDILDVTEE